MPIFPNGTEMIQKLEILLTCSMVVSKNRQSVVIFLSHAFHHQSLKSHVWASRFIKHLVSKHQLFLEKQQKSASQLNKLPSKFKYILFRNYTKYHYLACL